MKKINKKGYIPFKKTIIPAITIIMLVVAALLLIYTIDSKKFYKDHKVYDDEYFLHVYYLIMDKAKVPADISMEKTFSPDTSEFPEGVLTSSSTVVPLTKKGDYLYADLDEFVSKDLIAEETDYLFTNFNNNGEVIDGCEYDKKTNIIKVPVSYYENKTKEVPIQVEIQTLMDEKTFNNHEIEVNVKKFVTKKVKTSNNSGTLDTIIKIGKNGPGKLIKDNIHIYLNNATTELEDEMYEIDGDKISIHMPSHLISKLDVKVDYAIKDAFAASHSDFDGDPNNIRGIHLSAPLDVDNIENITFSLTVGDTIQYCGQYGDDCFTNDGGGWRYRAANWSYTYYEIPGQGWAADSMAYFEEYLYVYRVHLETLLNAIGGSLAESIEGWNSSNESTEWLAFYCSEHGGTATGSGDMEFRIQRISVGDRSVTIRIESVNSYSNQNAAAVLRFYWDYVPKGFKIQKIDKKNRAVAGLKITAFNKDDHSDTKTVETGSDGVATFENMTEDAHYYFYEDCNDAIEVDGTPYATLAAADIECTYPDIDHYYDGGTDVIPAGSGYTPTEDYQTAGYGHLTNENLAGLRVKKMDGSGNAIEGLTMHAINTSDSSDVRTAVTGSDGIATFSNLTKGVRYKFYEDCNSTVTVNGNQGTLENLDINCTYYNSARSYGGTSNGFLPSVDYRTEALVEMVDAKYRYCAVAHKTKGTTHKAEPGATLRLQVASGVCDKGQIDTSIVTGSDGYVQFTDLGHCNSGGTGTVSVTDATHLASLIGNASRSITLIRSTVKVSKSGGLDYRGLHYNEGAEIAITDADWNSYKAYVTETCDKNSAAAIEFEDKGYLLYWEKQNQSLKSNGQPTKMANVRFNVKKGNTTIRVKTTKANYTDIENQTKSCYEYTEETGNNTTTELVSDANGMVCIYNFPLEENYTITEVATTI